MTFFQFDILSCASAEKKYAPSTKNTILLKSSQDHTKMIGGYAGVTHVIKSPISQMENEKVNKKKNTASFENFVLSSE
jgi:hypothetical protein